MADLGGELVEVPPLDGLQPIRHTMQRRVRGRVVPDARGRPLGVGPIAFEASAVALAPEAGKPDAGFGPRPAAHQPHEGGFEPDAENIADALEILIDRVPPIVVGTELAIPAARLFLGRIGEFGELVDGGADDLRHRRPPRSAPQRAIRACSSSRWISARRDR